MSWITFKRSAAVVLSGGLFLGMASYGPQSAGSADASDRQETDREPNADGDVHELMSWVLVSTAGVSSVRVTGEMETQGYTVGHGHEVDREGRCRKYMTFPDFGNVETVRVDDEVWVSPPTPYWLQAGGTEAVEMYQGMYVHGPVDDPDLATHADGCDVFSAFSLLDFGDEHNPAQMSLGPETTYEGKRAITVLIEEEEPEGSISSTLLVAAEGKPYPLHLTTEMVFVSPGPGTMVQRRAWHDYGGYFEVAVPPEAMSVAISDMAPEHNPFPLTRW
ncbi:hypothetical protein GCM10009716_38920 [Streptomyces sodiiphilus]|uniref:Uncharacterized protein n=1 Tax=Streptomyces sodiiphilus TaxID=226217 RepID=A0ABN2PPS6_9ACTN